MLRTPPRCSVLKPNRASKRGPSSTSLSEPVGKLAKAGAGEKPVNEASPAKTRSFNPYLSVNPLLRREEKICASGIRGCRLSEAPDRFFDEPCGSQRFVVLAKSGDDLDADRQAR